MNIITPEEAMDLLEDHIKRTHPVYKFREYFNDPDLKLIVSIDRLEDHIGKLRQILCAILMHLPITESFRNLLYESTVNGYKRSAVDEILKSFRDLDYILFNPERVNEFERTNILLSAEYLISQYRLRDKLNNYEHNKLEYVRKWLEEYKYVYFNFYEEDHDLRCAESQLERIANNISPS